MEHTKKESEFRCSACNETFGSKAQLEEHAKQRHQ
jgi:hypothetical protein